MSRHMVISLHALSIALTGIWHIAADLIVASVSVLAGAVGSLWNKMGDFRTNDEDTQKLPSSAKPRVLVTGFGPFGEHTVNASWESVQQLKSFPDLVDAVELIIEEIPVVYSEVQSIVPELWKRYEPDFVIHCGVSGLLAHRNAIQIEKHAHNFGYYRPDVCSEFPSGGCFSVEQEKKCLSTGIVLDELMTMAVEEQRECSLACQVSEDAGRYLCEFIYYTSLSINADRTLFIHVPPLHKPFCATEIARAIKLVILRMSAKYVRIGSQIDLASVEEETEGTLELAGACL